MYTPQIAASREFPQDSLVKHFDAEGRIVRIDFKLSGKYVLIEYLPEGTDGHSQPRKMWWSDGHVYLSWKEGDQFRYEHIVRSFTEESKGRKMPPCGYAAVRLCRTGTLQGGIGGPSSIKILDRISIK